MLVVAIIAGLLIGLSLGALGGGGSILAVPVLVYLLDQSPVAATTGSLLIVGISSATGALAAWKRGNVYLGRGVTFGAIGIAGAFAGATLSVHVDPQVLLAAFSGLMLLVAVVMLVKQLRARNGVSKDGLPVGHVDDPIIAIRPQFMCNCPRALKVVATATFVGLLTGFFGVGGGFLVVPALVLALALPMPVAVGTSLVVITINSASAFVVRLSNGAQLDWAPIITLTIAAVVGSLVGARVAHRANPRVLGLAFSVLLIAVAVYTAARSLPGLFA